MATVAETPAQALEDVSAFRIPSSEIIDVDSFDEHLRPPPIENQDSVILLLDSDEEESDNAPPTRRRRLVSPPPPRHSPGTRIPPTPPVPQDYVEFTSFPRNRVSAPSPPVVRPIDQPFPFETLHGPSPFAGPSRRHSNRHNHIRYTQELQPEPRSHHVPALGLGGALISINREQMDARFRQWRESRRSIPVRARATEETGLFNRAIHRVLSFVSSTTLSPPESRDAHVPDLFGDWQVFDPPFSGVRFRTLEETAPEYDPMYTHPEKSEAGYVFDFMAPESPSPTIIDLEASDQSSGAGPSKLPESTIPKATTLLVCARCLDPLVTGASLVGEETRKRKIWALRCGHMIDGKCLNVLGSPYDVVDAGNSENEAEAGCALLPGPQFGYQGKGKGRVVDIPLCPPSGNPMRSKLRPRGSFISSIESSHTDHAPSTVLGKRNRLPKSKYEGLIYEWNCPVPSCRHLHASVKVDDAWVPEPDQKYSRSAKGKGRSKWAPGISETVSRGAIAVFV